MKKSELIKELQKSIETYGDGEVSVQDQYSESTDNRIETRNAINDKIHDSDYEFTIIY